MNNDPEDSECAEVPKKPQGVGWKELMPLRSRNTCSINH